MALICAGKYCQRKDVLVFWESMGVGFAIGIPHGLVNVLDGRGTAYELVKLRLSSDDLRG